MGEPRQITRRHMVGALAAAGAATLVRPARSLAGSLTGGPSVWTDWIGPLSGISAAFASRRFVMVGVEWQGPREARIELRARALSGRWSPWVAASALGHDADPTVEAGRRGRLYGEPIWTGPADQVQLRSDRAVHGVRLAFVSVPVSPGLAAVAAGAFPRALPVLDAGPGQPPILARRGWARGRARPRHAPEYGSIKLGFVHHTVNPNGYSAGEVPAMLTAIFAYHVHVRGWWDIGYNFVIDRFGRIWEARAGGIDMPVIGAQAGGYNAESTGVAMLGDFMNVIPSPAAIRSLEQLLAWKLSLHGIPSHGRVKVVVDPAAAFYTPFRPGAHVWLPRVAGHRQGDTTDCPGNALFAQLPAIRSRIAALAGTPARITLNTPAAGLTAGGSVALSGQLTSLTGAPLPGSPVELQQLDRGAERTVALATTDSQGAWSATVSLQRNAAIRALHRPQPATVSDRCEIAIAPAITLQVLAASPLQVSGTISPSKSHVTIDVYRAASQGGKPVSRQRLLVSNGSFQGSLAITQPGNYVLIARSRRDRVNAAGQSPPVSVAVT
ncbi:MAG TPA: N-acetylmuramoyl-L-alanine amidase [Solirubrobacteraceae bacterium]|nr:N-acetylmuramoyl-L-alanine amidase [Solirubrobacteraceae bacterium]